MKPRPSARWIWGMAFLLVLGPALLWWALTPSLKVYPVTSLLPNRIAAVARISNLEQAWQRHWQRRGQTKPEDAVRELMEALDTWPKWVKKYGERGAETRLWLYQRALFNAAGDEAWLVFGEYGGDQPGAGQVGLVALIRSRTSVAARVGDLMNLVMSDYQLSAQKYKGVTIYEYRDKKVSRSVTFCQVGGWICASLQQRGLGPLPVMIDRLADGHSKPAEFAADWWQPAQPQRPSALSMAAWPERFWGQLRLFRQQRNEGLSEESEERLQYWQQRLDGIDRMELTQTGESLFDLKLEAIGPRPAELTRSLAFDQRRTSAPLEAVDLRDRRPQIAQLDISLGLARLVTPLAGVPTESLMKGIDGLKPWIGTLCDDLRDRVQDLPPDVEGRMGLALYPGALLPEAAVWLDDAPERSMNVSPGQYWPQLASATPDRFYSIPELDAAAEKTVAPDPGDASWLEFERAIWSMPPSRPILFATVQFERVLKEIRQNPAKLFGKKTEKRLRRAERIVKAVSLATGGAAARLDAMADRWTLRVETP